MPAVSMVLGRCLTLAIAGVIPGVALAYVAGRSMAPALRAVRIDPITAIRTE